MKELTLKMNSFDLLEISSFLRSSVSLLPNLLEQEKRELNSNEKILCQSINNFVEKIHEFVKEDPTILKQAQQTHKAIKELIDGDSRESDGEGR